MFYQHQYHNNCKNLHNQNICHIDIDSENASFCVNVFIEKGRHSNYFQVFNIAKFSILYTSFKFILFSILLIRTNIKASTFFRFFTKNQMN